MIEWKRPNPCLQEVYVCCKQIVQIGIPSYAQADSQILDICDVYHVFSENPSSFQYLESKNTFICRLKSTKFPCILVSKCSLNLNCQNFNNSIIRGMQQVSK